MKRANLLELKKTLKVERKRLDIQADVMLFQRLDNIAVLTYAWQARAS